MTGVEKTKTAVMTGAGGDTGQAISREFVAGGRVVAGDVERSMSFTAFRRNGGHVKTRQGDCFCTPQGSHSEEFEQMSEIATEIRHVTNPGANLFAELGFSENEAELYHGESRKHIEELLS